MAPSSVGRTRNLGILPLGVPASGKIKVKNIGKGELTVRLVPADGAVKDKSIALSETVTIGEGKEGLLEFTVTPLQPANTQGRYDMVLRSNTLAVDRKSLPVAVSYELDFIRAVGRRASVGQASLVSEGSGLRKSGAGDDENKQSG